MSKWYQDAKCNEGTIISSRVRLARNLKKYNFRNKIADEEAKKTIEDVKSAITDSRTAFGHQFEYICINETEETEKFAMVEKHIISPELMKSDKLCGVLVTDYDTISIMLNEEDHIRIQSIIPGDNIDEAYDLADKVDDLIEESVEYAFCDKYGYLTSCPTNVGTGLRASYMMHLPELERLGQIKNIIQAISKFGITVRGIYGEGSEAMGSMYQISNQVTLGQNEKDIINNLKRVAAIVVEREEELQRKVYENNKDDIEDKIWRSYGILSNTRKITAKDAMNLISNIAEGKNMGIAEVPMPKMGLFELMVNIQPATLQMIEGKTLSSSERDKFRADYIRKAFS